MKRVVRKKRPGDVYIEALKTGRLPHSDIPLPKMMLGAKGKGQEVDTPQPSPRAMDKPHPGRVGKRETTQPVPERQSRPFRFGPTGRLQVDTGGPGKGQSSSVAKQRPLGRHASPEGLASERTQKPPERRSKARKGSRTGGEVDPSYEPVIAPQGSGQYLTSRLSHLVGEAGDTDAESHPVEPAIPQGGEGELCPLLGAPCIGPDCRWWDQVSDCSVTSSLRIQSEVVGRINSLIALIEYLSTRT